MMLLVALRVTHTLYQISIERGCLNLQSSFRPSPAFNRYLHGVLVLFRRIPHVGETLRYKVTILGINCISIGILNKRLVARVRTTVPCQLGNVHDPVHLLSIGIGITNPPKMSELMNDGFSYLSWSVTGRLISSMNNCSKNEGYHSCFDVPSVPRNPGS